MQLEADVRRATGTIQVTALPNGTQFDIDYTGVLGNANLGTLTAQGSGSVPSGTTMYRPATVLDGGGNQVQTLTISGGGANPQTRWDSRPDR